MLICQLLFQVLFRNEQSGEYLFYYVSFKALPPGVMATIDLSTPVRKSTSHVVTLQNPLNSPVTFNSQCSVVDIQLPPSFTVPPLSEVSHVTVYIVLVLAFVLARFYLAFAFVLVLFLALVILVLYFCPDSCFYGAAAIFAVIVHWCIPFFPLVLVVVCFFVFVFFDCLT